MAHTKTLSAMASHYHDLVYDESADASANDRQLAGRQLHLVNQMIAEKIQPHIDHYNDGLITANELVIFISNAALVEQYMV